MNRMMPSSRFQAQYHLRIFDVICAALSPPIAYLLRDTTFLSEERLPTFLAYTIAAFIMTLAVFAWLRVGHALSRFVGSIDAVPILRACFLAAAAPALGLSIMTRLENVPRSLPIIHFLVLSALVLGGRLISQKFRRPSADPADELFVTTGNTIVIGANRLTWFYIRMIETLSPGKNTVVAILDSNARFRNRSICNCPVIGEPLELEHVICEFQSHGVKISKIVLAEDRVPLPVEVVAQLREFCAANAFAVESLAERLGYERFEEAPVEEPSIIVTQIQARRYWRARRVLDSCIAAIALVVFSPLLLMVALLVAIDVGSPIVFWQQRIGRKNRSLHVYKFRTLKPPLDDNGEPVSDALRLSSIGAFIRATRLDELPQLFNVLIGEMAIIGPRPLLPFDQPPDPRVRLAVPPGVTGWAQVCGGKLITSEEKNALDEYYVRNASFMFDLKIIVMTFTTLFLGDRRNNDVLLEALDEKAANAPL